MASVGGLQIGDIVDISPIGLRRGMRPRQGGTIAGFSSCGRYPGVIWPGNKTRSTYHPSFLETEKQAIRRRALELAPSRAAERGLDWSTLSEAHRTGIVEALEAELSWRD